MSNTPEWYEQKAELARRTIEFYAQEGDIDKMLLWTEIEEEASRIAMILRDIGEA
jgi:hypothetical protein